jgi:hypothetical protein
MVLDGIEHCYKIIHNKQPITTNINETGCIIDVSACRQNIRIAGNRKSYNTLGKNQTLHL